MQIGIVGLPLCGKSTLYQTITKTHLDISALSKVETHHAVVRIPDGRLDKLSSLFSPKSTVHATIEFVDVVRMFDNEAVSHPEGSIDPLRDIATFETEFILSDLAIIEQRVDRIKKQ